MEYADPDRPVEEGFRKKVMATERFFRRRQSDSMYALRELRHRKKGGEKERRSASAGSIPTSSYGPIPAGADLWKIQRRAAKKAASLEKKAEEAESMPGASKKAKAASLRESAVDLLRLVQSTRDESETRVQAALRAASAARSIAHREAFAGLARVEDQARRGRERRATLARRSEDAAMVRFLDWYSSIRSRSAALPEVDRRDRNEVSVLMGLGLTRPEAVTINRMNFLRTPFLQGLKDSDGTVIATPEQTRRFMLIEYQTLSEEVARYTQSDEFKEAIKGKDFEFAKALILAKAEPEGEAPAERAGESDEAVSTAASGSDE